ncbi:hypothetical protein [Absidia glauca]|uniref:HORMA domain-containing protein n=1 Tax=Absidia glauca TaxID=4829 RepID=A0A168NG06_ABSGL|nr:hypothetical protein [Absidia glauca]
MASSIALDGSSDLVVDFFECSLYSILYLRGILCPDDFVHQKRFGTVVMWPVNLEVSAYVDQIIDQLRVWLKTNQVCEMILLIKSKPDFEVVERWQFSIHVDGTNETKPNQSDAKATSQIKAILRQIFASVSILPSLDGIDCTYNVQVHVEPTAELPSAWKEESGPSLIAGGGEHVRLATLSTDGRRIEPYISYRMENPF